jgi:hypothetical protein
MHYLISDTRGRLVPLNTDVVLGDRWLAKVSIKINALLNLLFRPRIVSINSIWIGSKDQALKTFQ